MARVTARQAFTRAKTKRQKSKAEMQKAIIDARARFVKQLSTLGLGAQQADDKLQQPGTSNGRHTGCAGNKKITEYFPTTTSLDFMSKPKGGSPKTSISVDGHGIELITIYDSDAENDLVNNNANSQNASPYRRKNSLSDDNRSANSSTSDNFSSPLQNIDIKPSNLDLNQLDRTFTDMKVNVRLDEDIEIVEMLPPIPLRDHPVFDIDEN